MKKKTKIILMKSFTLINYELNTADPAASQRFSYIVYTVNPGKFS